MGKKGEWRKTPPSVALAQGKVERRFKVPTELRQPSTTLCLPPDSTKHLKRRLKELVDKGCDEQFLLRFSKLCQLAREHRVSERSSERVAYWHQHKPSQRQVSAYLAQVERLAAEIDKFQATVPDLVLWLQENVPDEFEHFLSLPITLRRYVNLARKMARGFRFPYGAAAANLRHTFLAALAGHVKQHTGQYHWDVLADLIAAWGGPVDAGSLAKIYRGIPRWYRRRIGSEFMQRWLNDLPAEL